MIRIVCHGIMLAVFGLATVWLALACRRLIFDPAVVPTVAPSRWVPNTDATRTVPALDVRPLPSLNQTTERPLFFEGRRLPADAPIIAPPPPPAPPVLVTIATPPPAWKLLGVVALEGKWRAMIGGASSGDLVGEGDMVDGWLVAEIRADRVTLRQGLHNVTLQLYEGARND